MVLDNDLQELLKGLNSEKTVDRRKYLEIVSNFIRNNKNKLTEIDSKKWKVAINIIKNSVENEISYQQNKTRGIEVLQKSVGPQFKSIVSDLMENEIISKSSIRSLYIFIYNTLSIPRQCEIFVIPFTVALKSMLKNKFACQSLDITQFKEFAELFQNLILDENFDGKKDVLDYISICYRTLICEYSEDLYEEEDTILDFFKDFFLQSSTKTHEKIYFNILCAFNHFIYFKGFNKARRIGSIGEELIENMCIVWREKTNDNLRIEFCRFFKAILNLNNLSSGPTQIEELYHLIRDMLNQAKIFSFHKKNLSITESKAQIERKKLFFSIGADIFYIFSKKKENKKEIKKRKKTSLKDDIFEYLVSNPKSLISQEYWLELMDVLLQKYTNWEEDFLETISQHFSDLIEKRENISILKISLRCLTSVGKMGAMKKKSEFWEKLWNLLMKLITTDSPDIVELIDSVSGLIAVYYSTLKFNYIFTVETVQSILESSYYQTSEYCSNSLILLLLDILSNKEIREFTKMEEIKKNILNWIINSFSEEKCRNYLNSKLVSIAVVSLCINNDSFVVLNIEEVGSMNDLSKLCLEDIEHQISIFQFLDNPLNNFESTDLIDKSEKDFFEPKELSLMCEISKNLLETHNLSPQSTSFLFRFFLHFVKIFPIEILNDQNVSNFKAVFTSCMNSFISIIGSNSNDDQWNSVLTAIEEVLSVESISIDSSIFPKDYIKKWNLLKDKILCTSAKNTDFDDMIGSQPDLMDVEVVDYGKIIKIEENTELQLRKLNTISKLISKFPAINSQTILELNSENNELKIIECLSKFQDLSLKQKSIERLSKIQLRNSDDKVKVLEILRDIGLSLKVLKTKKNLVVIPDELVEKFELLYGSQNLNSPSRLLLLENLSIFTSLNQENEKISELFLTIFDNMLTNDKCYKNRIFILDYITDLFEFYDPNELFDQMLPDLLKSINQKNDELLTKSSIIALSKMAVHSEYIEKEYLSIALTNFVEENSIMRDWIQKSLNFVSLSLKYDSIRNHLEEHFTFIVDKWIKNELNFQKFPFVLLKKNSFAEFFDEYIEHMIIGILCKDSNLFVTLCKTSGKEPKMVLEHTFPVIYSFLSFLPKSHSKYAEINKLIENLKKDSIETEIEYILLNMLSYLNTEDDNLVKIDEKQLKEIIERISSKFNQNIESLLSATKSRLHLILLHLCEKISNTKRKNFRIKQFDSLLFFIKLMGKENVQNESNLRFIIHIILNSAQFLELSSKVCSALQYVISETVTSQSSFREIGRNLNSIVTHLINLFDKTGEKSCLDIIKTLITNSNMKIYMKELKPFPITTTDFIQFEKMRIYSQKSTNIHIFDEINKFTNQEGELGLSQICRLVKEKKNLLIQELEGDQMNHNLITKLIGKLSRICAGDHEGKYEAGECLKEIGLTIPKFINSFTQDFNEIHREYEFTNMNSTENYSLESKVHILSLLNSLTTDKNIKIMKISSILLKKILNTQSGKVAFKNLPADIKMNLQPFTSSSKDSISSAGIYERLKIDEPKEDALDENLFDTSNKTHEDWIKNLTYSLIKNVCKDEVYLACSILCLNNALFSEQLFQFAIFDIFTNNKSDKSLNEKLSTLLSEYVLNNTKTKGRSTRLVLNALNMLRTHIKEEIKKIGIPKTRKPLNEYDYWFKISYLSVSKAALRSSCYFTALMYVETFCEQSNISILPNELCYEEDVHEYQSLLLQIYQNIDEPDGIYGINKNYGLKSKILKYKHENDYEKVLGNYDILAQKSNNQIQDSIDLTIGIFDALKNIGYNSLLSTTMKSDSINNLVKQSPSLQDTSFELAWRTSQFDVDIQTPKDGLNKKIYRALKSLSLGESNSFWKYHQSAYLHVINQITTSNRLYTDLSHLQMLSEIENAWNLRWKNLSDSQASNEPYVPKNNSEIVFFGSNSISEHPFTYIEPILSLRTTLLNIIGRKDLIPSHLCEFSRMARKAKRFQLASSLIHSLSLEEKKTTPLWMFEDSKILWELGEQDSAISIGNFLISNLKKDQKEQELLGKVYFTVGKWLNQTKTEGVRDIINHYLIDAVKYSKDQSQAYFTLAKYFDNIYTDIIRKMKSDEYKNLSEIRKNNENLLKEYENSIKQRGISDERKKEIERQIRQIKKVSISDHKESEELKKKCHISMIHAMENYGYSSKNSSKYDIHIVFRICSFWFSNASNESTDDYNDQVNKIFEELLKIIKVHKFIPLVYQIASRMGSHSKEFQKINMKLLKNLGKKHPHHSILQIFALLNGARLPGDQHSKDLVVVDEQKINSAKELINQLRMESKEMIDEYESLIEAYIEVAFLPLDQRKYRNWTSPVKFDSSLKITNIRNLKRVPIPTIDISPEIDGNYDKFESIDKFDEYFSLAGGINLPKIVKCHTSSGLKYRQLVKGKDDLRQDAVMQQIFELCNKLLSVNPETKKRSLRVRTYKVIPLSPTSGLLGWVENTMPLAEWLTGTPGKNEKQSGHVRYHPNEPSPGDIRKRMSQYDQKSSDEKYENYKKVAKKFTPVFHHFFLENFSMPSEWFSKRIAYTRSVASNSCVGYVIGLGDRHSHNILMDLKSAEVVHIDLGVAFGQGLLLPIPELVPFRLTRDICDGFGVSGTEGIFRRCSEETMNVLRNNASLLNIIVEVFIHDPLFRWSINPQKALNLQRNREEESINFDSKINQTSSNQSRTREAERTLLRLSEKLQGYENGEILSTKGQVNKLIKQATDPKLLSNMFSGWTSWV
eukprot:gene1910-1050_t